MRRVVGAPALVQNQGSTEQARQGPEIRDQVYRTEFGKLYPLPLLPISAAV
jgi:hypothetical protein